MCTRCSPMYTYLYTCNILVTPLWSNWNADDVYRPSLFAVQQSAWIVPWWLDILAQGISLPCTGGREFEEASIYVCIHYIHQLLLFDTFLRAEGDLSSWHSFESGILVMSMLQHVEVVSYEVGYFFGALFSALRFVPFVGCSQLELVWEDADVSGWVFDSNPGRDQKDRKSVV